MSRAALVAAIAIGLATTAGAGADALAYPHFQLTSGTAQCSLCHYAPAGGGLLTAWGRSESADTLSTFGGQPDLLHGLAPRPGWLDVGGDVRVAALVHDVGASRGAETAVFPMQLDVGARVRLGRSLSVVANIGLRGAVREPDLQDGSTRQEAGALSALISREHYLYYKSRSGLYARAGRYYAPFGLRLPDHTTYVRRATGFNLLEETYGISGGHLGRDLEIHVTAHVSDELRWAPRREAGGTAMLEWRPGAAVIGASSRAVAGSDEVRAIGGGFAKLYFEGADLLLMAEADAIWQRFTDADRSRWQLAAYAGPVWLPVRGLSIALAYELLDQEVLTSGLERHAASTWVSWLPTAHLEIAAVGRVQLIGESNRAVTGLLQIHYYL